VAFLETRELRTCFSLSGGFLSRLAGRDAGSVAAVDGVSISVERGGVFGVVGESGSGKTTLARSILRLVEPTSGEVLLDGRRLLALTPRQFRPYRRRMQIVFQDPQAALNPAMTIGAAVAHPLQIHGIASGGEARRRAGEMLERVGLEPAGRFLGAYPADLSGGQKQRAVIARALILGPELVVADEPVSMLDASVRTRILALMLDLQRSFGLTYLFITHDLATARLVSDRIAILYLGQVVEQGPTPTIFADPRHPYTRALLAAVPQPDPARRSRKELPRGEVPDAASPPANCRFHPRCPRAFAPCGFEGRDLVDAIQARWARLPEEQFAAEHELLDGSRALQPDGYRLVIRPARAGSLREVAELVERLREEEADAAFRHIEAVRQEARAVVVELSPGRDPQTVAVGGALVACHLYPPPGEPAFEGVPGI